MTLIGSIVVLLFAQDAYVESNDIFFLRATRFGGYSKIALLSVFLPVTLFFLVGSIFSMIRSCRTPAAIEEAEARHSKISEHEDEGIREAARGEVEPRVSNTDI